MTEDELRKMYSVVYTWMGRHPEAARRDPAWAAQNLLGDLMLEGIIEGDMAWWAEERDIAARYFDAEQGPMLWAGGMTHDGIASVRRHYIEDVVKNRAAMEQLREWAKA